MTRFELDTIFHRNLYAAIRSRSFDMVCNELNAVTESTSWSSIIEAIHLIGAPRPQDTADEMSAEATYQAARL